jgi:hypothetical protein
MALQATTFVKGRIGNLTFYPLGDTWVARSIPAHVKQAAATKLRSRNFGVAVKAGKTLRQLLLPLLSFPKDKRMQTKFAGAIANWLGVSDPAGIAPVNNIPFVNHFSFNDATSVSERWRTVITVLRPSDNYIEVHIPAFIPTAVITAPVYTDVVECNITVASCKLIDATALGSFNVTISIPYNSELRNEQVLSLPVKSTTGAIVITAVSLRYQLANGQKDMRPSFMPSSVINAMYC